MSVGILKEKTSQISRKNSKSTSKKIASLGLTVSTMTASLRERFKIPKKAKGLLVLKVDANGPAEEKGLQPGNLIVEVGQQEVSTPQDAIDLIAKAKGTKSFMLIDIFHTIGPTYNCNSF